MREKNKKYRFYWDSAWYWSRKFPFLHKATWKAFVDPVPVDKDSKFPKDIELVEIDGMRYKLESEYRKLTQEQKLYEEKNIQ